MAHYNQDWDDLGQSIQDIVNRAVNSRDYQQLNQTIRQAVGHIVDVGSEAVRKAKTDAPASSRSGYQAGNQHVSLYGSTFGSSVAGILKTCGGGLISLFSFPILLAAIFSGMPIASWLLVVTLMLAGSVGGVCMIYTGVTTLGMVKRYKIYRSILGQSTHCSVERLAQSVGKSKSFVRKELWQMIGKGLFREGHMDKEQTCLITSHETFQYYEQSRLTFEEQQRQEPAVGAQKAPDQKTGTAHNTPAQNPQIQEVLERGDAFIAQIRKCNDAIPGEEISEKIYRMELIVQRIFERAEAHPEIVPDLKKLMDYYLPMTVKLLGAYADMDAQPIQGETIQASKREIEASLDTLNLAFEKLLDSIFKDTALDVSSDISVLNTMLAQEGLAEDEFSKMKKEQNL